MRGQGAQVHLFLTSKVRLHCDHKNGSPKKAIATPPFPDLKGQAPLRHDELLHHGATLSNLFLTSKVRLHCDTVFFAFRHKKGKPFS